MKVYINSQGHMTKMAAMAINSKNLLKSSPEPEGIRGRSSTKFYVNHDLGVTLTYLMARST